ncbi:sigma-70 family RNA polymerase sigma factor [Streptomyces sp. NPDC001982]|uniref:sigma-70 family RNA polymerase sigma factor n=1 Tax=Streptomyces sp. NPDC001982 TaxID=3154405 RepID=UPI003330FAEA
MPDPAELVLRFEHQALPFLDQVYAAAVQMTRDRADAEELVQQTYRRAFEAFGSFAGETSLKVWLFRVLADTALGTGDGRQRPPRWTSSTGRPRRRSRGEQRPPFPAPQTAEAQALGRLSGHEVKTALRHLTRAFAIVVYLADVEDFSHTEIAEILGIPTKTAISRLHHGRRRLHQLLTDAARQRGFLD